MNKNRIKVLVSYFLILIMLCGCTTMYERRSSYNEGQVQDLSLAVAPILQFRDIPVPAGFKVLESQSFTFQNDLTRVALLKYSGSANADLIVAFFKEQMPLYNWNPINIIEYERRILNYEKESESCIVTIESKGTRSIVTVAISPKSRPMKVEVKSKEIK